MNRNIKRIVIHCTAGFGNIESIQRYWRSKGWKSPGYHRLIDIEGNIVSLADFDSIVNGAFGFNSNSIHISYIGGVDPDDYTKAKDTRTDVQEASMIMAIKEALYWIKENGQDISRIEIVGHRDLSPDKNSNGVVDSWERIKECPSFDVIPWIEIIKPALI